MNRLENLIQEAVTKINGKNELSICRFIPSSGGYMHYFTDQLLPFGG